ncbi:MAG: P-loop NTPase family protein [Henriciella sp.]
MHDLRKELDPVWRAATRLSPASGGARVLMFTSALRGEGVTSMAASFACMAALRSEKPVWLVDLDLRRNPVYRGFKSGFARDVGQPGRAYDASLRQTPIYTVIPRVADARQDRLLTAHDIDGLPLLVTRFRGERLKSGQRVLLQDSPNWWRALREMAGWVIIDAPALEQSSAALTMAGIADGTILVVEADHTTPNEIDGARRELEAKNGRVIGAVLNRVKADARFANRFSA